MFFFQLLHKSIPHPLETLITTVWKFDNFPITHILCEINFGDSRSARYVILTRFEALNFDFYEFLYLEESEIYRFDEIQSLQNS